MAKARQPVDKAKVSEFLKKFGYAPYRSYAVQQIKKEFNGNGFDEVAKMGQSVFAARGASREVIFSVRLLNAKELLDYSLIVFGDNPSADITEVLRNIPLYVFIHPDGEEEPCVDPQDAVDFSNEALNEYFNGVVAVKPATQLQLQAMKKSFQYFKKKFKGNYPAILTAIYYAIKRIGEMSPVAKDLTEQAIQSGVEFGEKVSDTAKSYRKVRY